MLLNKASIFLEQNGEYGRYFSLLYSRGCGAMHRLGITFFSGGFREKEGLENKTAAFVC
jgi:hypothetical protein